MLGSSVAGEIKKNNWQTKQLANNIISWSIWNKECSISNSHSLP